MRWIKRLLIIIPALVILLIGGAMLINALTPRPISILTRQQFDTSKKHQVYPRPKKFKQKTAGLTVQKNVKYGKHLSKSVMDVYLPPHASKRPVLFWMHGGAYVGGDKRDCQDYLKLLSADTNQVVVNINYALAPERHHATPVRQLNQAIQATKQKYGKQIDWSNVTIGGDSAGAQISSEYVLALQNKKIRKMDQVQPVLKSQQVKKFVSLSGLLEPQKFTQVSDRTSSFLYAKCGWAYFADKHFEKKKSIRDLSIISNVKDWAPKTFLTDGNTNTFTKQMNATAKAISDHNGQVTKVSYPKKTTKLNHEYQFDFSNKEAQETYAKLVDFLSK
ncbi:lipase [Pediococcus acidilactici]|uniref:alpha/beta hydrolase n=1 Tax=Pediococcus acidilactici TaxID=1254 RepID=UPI00071AFA66|nr:alpha/beta hydrolase [Pediococcus acidilactici]KSV56158.1 lipase [Pediococcus acidilactici]